MEILRADDSDAEAIHALRMAVFAKVAEDYADPELPPLDDTLEEVRAELETRLVLKAVEHDRVVGTVGASEDDGVVLIGRLAVDPAHEGHGIGLALARAAEDAFPQARRFEVFTGDKSRRSLAIWRKLGYREDRREPVRHYELVHLSKDV
jgi:predicted N-acetyltransferase YhbS